MPPIIKNSGEAKGANMVSLVGGIIVAIGVFALLILLAGRPTPLSIGAALIIAGGVGAYVRIADL